MNVLNVKIIITIMLREIVVLLNVHLVFGNSLLIGLVFLVLEIVLLAQMLLVIFVILVRKIIISNWMVVYIDAILHVYLSINGKIRQDGSVLIVILLVLNVLDQELLYVKNAQEITIGFKIQRLVL